MNINLFSNFDKIESKLWKQQIQFELKGADYNETLVWENLDGIKTKPFYTKVDLPKELPQTSKLQPFKIIQEVYVKDSKKANFAAKAKLEKGANSLWFVMNQLVDLDLLFKDLPTENDYFISLQFADDAFLKQVIQLTEKFQLTIGFDPICHLTIDGNWFNNQQEDFNFLNKITDINKTLVVDGSIYNNAGGNNVQQLSYIAAHLTEYLNHASTSPEKVILKLAVSSHYFFEIAKLRALRELVQSVLLFFDCKAQIKIMAQPSMRNKTIYDYNVNMLRTTTENMSAILGGADYVLPIAYDTVYHKSNSFGDRIARNQLLILKHESYFDEVFNPADGSYYIESLTETFAQKALNLLKDIEKSGGFIHELFSLNIQNKIEESANKEQKWFDEGQLILLGTNKYPNPQDKMKNDLEKYPFVKVKPRQTIIKPIVAKRLAEAMEKHRIENEI